MMFDTFKEDFGCLNLLPIIEIVRYLESVWLHVYHGFGYIGSVKIVTIFTHFMLIYHFCSFRIFLMNQINCSDNECKLSKFTSLLKQANSKKKGKHIFSM